MNRIRKYRAWDYTQKTMFVSWTTESTKEALKKGVSIMESHEFRFDRDSGNMVLYTLQQTPHKFQGEVEYIFSPRMLLCPEYVIMDWTGMIDKTNKKIWEGDIVKHSIYNKLGVVKFGEGEYYPDHWSVSWQGWYVDGIDSPFDEYNAKIEFEVIGNIYENPELIKP